MYMKKIFLFLLIISALIGRAQNLPTIPVPNPTYFLKWIKVKDSVRGGIFFQGTNDTLATQAYARGFAGGALLPGVGIKVNGTTVSIDTANYRKQDSMYVVTDSTGIFKINGRLYPFKLRGGVWSFNGRMGAIAPDKMDYTAFYPRLDSTYDDPSFIQHLAFSKLISLPDSLAGYNILDAVQNKGNIYSLQAGAFTNRPAAGGVGSLFLATDSLSLYYNNGTSWDQITAPGSGATDSAVLASYGLLKTVVGHQITLKVDTTTLKNVFGSNTGGINQIFTKYGLVISGTDTASVDTAIFTRWSDTLNRIATRTYVNARGFIVNETDPVATGKSITINTDPLSGINISGTPAQSLGSSPLWRLSLDTTNVAATKYYVNHQGFLSAESDPVAQADTIIVQATPSAGILVAETAKQLLGNKPTWTVKADTSLLATRWYVGSRGYIASESDPVAIAKTVNLTTAAAAGIAITGLSSQALNGNPSWQIKADTSVLATKFFVNTGAPYLPLNWTAGPVIAGNSNFLHVVNGGSYWDNPSLRERTSIFGSTVALYDSAYAQGGMLQVLPTIPGIVLQKSNVAGHGLHVSQDSISLFDDAPSTASYFFAGGGAKFQGHVAGLVESTADSSSNLASTATVKRLLANYVPGNASNFLDMKKDFGAVGDGVTIDDSAFVRAARANNAVIVVPKGTYRLHSTIGFTGVQNLTWFGMANDSTRLISDTGVKTTLFIGKNTKHLRLQGLYVQNRDTTKAGTKFPCLVLFSMDTTFNPATRDSNAVTEYVDIINNTMVGNGSGSKAAGINIVAHRSGWGAYIRHVNIEGNRIYNMGASGGGALGEGNKTWLWDIRFCNNDIRHMGLADTTLGFGWSNSGRAWGMYVGWNRFTDITMIGVEGTGVYNSITAYNIFDSSWRNTLTCPYTFNSVGGITAVGNKALYNTVLDSTPAFPYHINQSGFTSQGNILRAWGPAPAVVGNFLLDSVRNSSFSGDVLISTMPLRPLLYIRNKSAGNTFVGSSITGVPTQNQLVLMSDAGTQNNSLINCFFDGYLNAGTLINNQAGASGNIITNSVSGITGKPGLTSGLPTSTSPLNYKVTDVSGQDMIYPFVDTTGQWLNRVYKSHDTVYSCKGLTCVFAYRDSAGQGNTNSNVGTGLRLAVVGTNNIKSIAAGFSLVGDSTTTANVITVKFDSTTGFHTQNYNDVRYRKGFLDSLAQGLLKDTTKIYNIGAGLKTAYPSVTGDSIVAKNVKQGYGMLISTQTDSSLLHAVDTTAMATRAYVLAHAGGSGNTNITVSETPTADSIYSSTGTGDKIDTANSVNAGAMSPFAFQVTHHRLVVRKGKFTTADTLAYSDADTLFLKGINFKYGLARVVTQDTIGASVDTSVIVSKTFLTARNYLQVESDPVASAKTITETQGVGILVSNSGTPQTIGFNPSFTIRADTTVTATRAYRQKGVDSVNAWVTSALAGKQATGTYYGPSDTSFTLSTRAYRQKGIDSVNNWVVAALSGKQPVGTYYTPTDTSFTLSTRAYRQKGVDSINAWVTASLALKAATLSPTFTGTPVAPTATAGTNTNQIATTAFVQNALTVNSTGTYNPVQLSGTTVTVYSATYFRMGNNVIVDGLISSAAAAGTYSVEISLPFNTTGAFTQPYQTVGQMGDQNGQSVSNLMGGVGPGTSSTGSAILRFGVPGGSTRYLTFHFVYTIF